MLRLFFVSLCLFCLFIPVGCKDPNEGRSNLSGTITIEGVPIENGTIVFQPLNPDPNIGVTGAQVQIVDGKYSITGGLGLLAGDYKVLIQSQRMVDKKTGQTIVGDKPDDPFSFTTENLIPEKYNTNSEIVFTVEDKKGPKTFDFDVKTE